MLLLSLHLEVMPYLNIEPILAMQNVPTSAMLTSLWWGSQILSILI